MAGKRKAEDDEQLNGDTTSPQDNGHAAAHANGIPKRVNTESQPIRAEPATSAAPATPDCPYLDTINRRLLDFDAERVCSVSNSNLHIYACLVCGRYFQGRSPHSHAYNHAATASHHLFIQLDTARVWCLPDGYEVNDVTLRDIQYNLRPAFTQHDTLSLDTGLRRVRTAASGASDDGYVVGLMGLNNLKQTDWLNVVLQSLVRVTRFRDHFLLASYNTTDTATAAAAASSGTLTVSSSLQSSAQAVALLPSFTLLMRKLCNTRAFRGHVSPHELLHALSTASNGQYRIDQTADPLQFLSFLINRLDREMKAGAGSAKGSVRGKAETIVRECFQGKVNVSTSKRNRRRSQQSKAEADGDDEKDEKAETRRDDSEDDEDEEKLAEDDDIAHPDKYTTTTTLTPFLYLSLSLPPMPLFQSATSQSILPTVPLSSLLSRFLPSAPPTFLPSGERRRVRLLKLPRYLILHYQRFQHNEFFREKNHTLVHFPLTALDLSPYLTTDPTAANPLPTQSMSVRQLLDECRAGGGSVAGVLERDELVRAVERLRRQAKGGKYDLLCNVVHDGEAVGGHYRVHVLHRGSGCWYEMDDLRVVTSETMAQMVGLSEAYIQIYERQEEDDGGSSSSN